MHKRLLYAGVAVVGLLSVLAGCKTGVEPSPSPGILKVTIKANEQDTTIVIRSDTSRFSRWDEFNLYISQGRLHRGDNYAFLYADPGIERIGADTVNILARQWLNGVPVKPSDISEIHAKNSRYIQYTIFNSYVPPGSYDSLTFNLTAYEILVFVPKVYQNPIQLPPGARAQMAFPANITVEAGGVTQIDLEISPFGSLSRYRDTYLFDRKVKIVGIQKL
jgi:hypothetical protein